MNLSSIIMTFVIGCYSFIVDVVRVIIFPLLRAIEEKNGWDLKKRQKLPSPVRDFRGKRVSWIHAASLGEAKLLLKFIDLLKRRHGDDRYVVTATTRNGVDFLEKHRDPSFCAIGYLPIDSISLVSRVIAHYSITRLWVIETELWPSLFFVCKKRSIPVGIVNGRIEPASFKWYRLLKWFLAWLLESVDIVFAQTEEYATRFTEIGISKDKIHVVGNMKGHIHLERPDIQDWRSIRNKLAIHEDEFVVTAGCIHAGEGATLHLFQESIGRLGYPCRLIIVPRYPNEIEAIVGEIGGEVAIFNECETTVLWKICIIDKIGILDDMYKIADTAIIGGTFIPLGGHNVWDAARFAIPVFFGRHYFKQKESGELLLNAGVGFSVTDGTSLGVAMHDVVKVNSMQFLSAQQTFIKTTNSASSDMERLLP